MKDLKLQFRNQKSEIRNRKSEVGNWRLGKQSVLPIPFSNFQLLISCLTLVSVFLTSCNHKTEKVTDSGMKYIVYKENPGPKAKRRDFVTVEMVYKTEYDSVLFDSRQNKIPMRFQLEQPPFAGSMEEGITYLAAGDSVTFFVSADSMVQKVFAKMTNGNYLRPGFLKSGSFLKFDVKLLRIQSELDASEEMYHELDRLAALEKSDIAKYIAEHHITEQPDTSGVYVIKNTEGKGAPVVTGKSVSINYTGRLFDGTVIDANDKAGKPTTLIIGNSKMLKGWDIAFRKLRQGDKATVIIPSAKAFGEEGVRNKMNGMYVVQPNTPLLFDIEILEVK